MNPLRSRIEPAWASCSSSPGENQVAQADDRQPGENWEVMKIFRDPRFKRQPFRPPEPSEFQSWHPDSRLRVITLSQVDGLSESFADCETTGEWLQDRLIRHGCPVDAISSRLWQTLGDSQIIHLWRECDPHVLGRHLILPRHPSKLIQTIYTRIREVSQREWERDGLRSYIQPILFWNLWMVMVSAIAGDFPSIPAARLELERQKATTLPLLIIGEKEVVYIKIA